MDSTATIAVNETAVIIGRSEASVEVESILEMRSCCCYLGYHLDLTACNSRSSFEVRSFIARYLRWIISELARCQGLVSIESSDCRYFVVIEG